MFEEEIDLSKVPSEYHDLAAVFSKEKALSLCRPIIYTTAPLNCYLVLHYLPVSCTIFLALKEKQ